MYTLLVLVSTDGDPESIHSFVCSCLRKKKSTTITSPRDIAIKGSGASTRDHGSIEDSSDTSEEDSDHGGGAYAHDEQVPLVARLSKGTKSLFDDAVRKAKESAVQNCRPAFPSPICSEVPGQASLISAMLENGDRQVWLPGKSPISSRVIDISSFPSSRSLYTAPHSSDSSSSSLPPPLAMPPPPPSLLAPSSRLVSGDDDLLLGQREMFLTSPIPKGTLIPWTSRRIRLLKEKPAGSQKAVGLCPYEFQFDWRGQTLVSSPDLRTPTPYANDYCGPNRSQEKKKRLQYRQNMRFCLVKDRWGCPFVFLMALRDIDRGEAAWVDYGAFYFSLFFTPPCCKSQRSLFLHRRPILAQLESEPSGTFECA